MTDEMASAWDDRQMFGLSSRRRAAACRQRIGEVMTDDEPELTPEEIAEQLMASLPPGTEVPEGGPLCNRAPGRTAADVNLEGAPFGFRATGDAAWDSNSDDFAMFTAEGNAAAAALVKTARLMVMNRPETEVLAWVKAEKARMAADEGERPHKRGGHAITGMSEVRDTMVRETIAYALDEAWAQAYGHRFGEE
jgi:hypothetical protein